MNQLPTFEFDGQLYLARDLPTHIERWTVDRKRLILAAFDAGFLTEEEALKRYYLSTEELDIWRRRLQNQGFTGLKATLHPSR